MSLENPQPGGQPEQRAEKPALKLLREYLSSAKSSESAPDSMAIIGQLKDLNGAWLSPEEYLELINELEPACLELVPLLEEKQLIFRGDCIPHAEISEIDNQTFYCANGIRNQSTHFENDEQKFQVLGNLLLQLCWRRNVARNYERRMQQDGQNDRVPVIVYGSCKHINGSVPEYPPSQYFHGDTDDMGGIFYSPKVIKLPPTTTRIKDESVEELEMFPQNPPRIAFGPPDLEGIEHTQRFREIQNKPPFNMQDADMSIFYLKHNKTYFHTMLLAHEMLSSLEKAGKDPRF